MFICSLLVSLTRGGRRLSSQAALKEPNSLGWFCFAQMKNRFPASMIFFWLTGASGVSPCLPGKLLT